MIRAHLSQIELNFGGTIELKEGGILLFIGPNNCGKSAALRDIHRLLSGSSSVGTIIKSVRIVRDSSMDQVYSHYEAARDEKDRYDLPGFGFYKDHLTRWWQSGDTDVGKFLAEALVSNLDTRSRLSDCDPPKVFDALKPFAAQHPFQRMYMDDKLEEKVSSAVRKAFKRDLVIHRVAGQHIPAFIGERPPVLPGEDRISRSYIERIENLDRLDSQGDGIKSFVSIVGRVITEDRSIQLIDEPEAFLHPPQAKMIGQIIGFESKNHQTLIATHSSDILQGLLGSEGDRVSVVRLTRSHAGARADFLPSDYVKELWRDPILRFGNVLDGLFHEGVIVTEADADCRFYEAVHINSFSSERTADIHYTYSGGKDRIPVLVRALSCLNVPVASIVDFDVLNSERPLRNIIEAHGGDWSRLESDWRSLKAKIEQKGAFLAGDHFRQEVTSLLSQIPKGGSVPKETLTRIKSLTRSASPWDYVKNAGIDGVSLGEARVIAERLLRNLKDLGVFVVPKGQMESFCPTVGAKGVRWVEEVLRRDLQTDSELISAREFTRDVQLYLQQRAQ